MNFAQYIHWFFGGVFLFNAIPHLASGVMGRAFQTPFAKPSGVGLSSATVNVLWGFVNLLVAWLLLVHAEGFAIHAPADALAVGLGGLAISLFAARYFGRFHGGNTARVHEE